MFKTYTIQELESKIPKEWEPRYYELHKIIIEDALRAFKSTGSVAINAVAGSGKTIVSVFLSLLRGKKTFFICTQRDIATSTYNNIVSDLNTCNLDVTVQLFYSGKVIKSSTQNQKAFDAQIIVTTIDGFLAPSYKFNYLSYSDILTQDIVFDEYHLILTIPRMLAYFSKIMMMRNQYGKDVHSIFISATHDMVTHAWETNGSTTIHLPAKNKHYPAPLKNNKYELQFAVATGTRPPMPNWVEYYDTVSQTRLSKAEVIGHGDALPIHKWLVLQKSYAEFGKDVAVKSKLAAAYCHWGSQGLNVTFDGGGTSACPISTFLQRTGRVIRFSDNQTGKIIIYEIPQKDASERALWDNIWIDYAKPSNSTSRHHYRDLVTKELKDLATNNPTVSVDELYIWYNQMMQKHERYYKDRVNEIVARGEKSLLAFKPSRVFNETIISQDIDPPDEDPVEIPVVEDGTEIEEAIDVSAFSGKNLRTEGKVYYLLTPHKDSSGRICEWIERQVDYDYIMRMFSCDGYQAYDLRVFNKAHKKYEVGLAKFNHPTLKQKYPKLSKSFSGNNQKKKNFKYPQDALQRDIFNAMSRDMPIIDMIYCYDVKNFKDDPRQYVFEDLGEGLIKQ
jgi:hypothetical protein